MHTEGYSSSALKHGPFALLHDGFPVVLFAPDDAHFAKNQNAFQEILSRGAAVVVVRTAYGTVDTEMEFDGCASEIVVPRNATFQAILNVIPVQIMAYRLAVRKGINPDTPKNLAKVVTVE